MLRAICSLTAILGLVAPLGGQEQPLAFDVACVRPNDSGPSGGSIRRAPGGTFSVTNTPLWSLIAFAYQVQNFQLVELPDWARSERFDIRVGSRRVHEDERRTPRRNYS